MKKLMISLLMLPLALLAQKDLPMLPLGSEAPLAERQMKNIDGLDYNLHELKGEKGLLLIFSCNTCPFVLGWEDQYPILAEAGQEMGLGMALVNSNAKNRAKVDSYEAMQAHAKKADYRFPYLVDREHQLADAMGARTTPHVYLFDANLNLVYRGSINDKYERKDKTAQQHYLLDAMRQLKAGSPVSPDDTREIGCSIKRLAP